MWDWPPGCTANIGSPCAPSLGERDHDEQRRHCNEKHNSRKRSCVRHGRRSSYRRWANRVQRADVLLLRLQVQREVRQQSSAILGQVSGNAEERPRLLRLDRNSRRAQTMGRLHFCLRLRVGCRSCGARIQDGGAHARRFHNVGWLCHGASRKGSRARHTGRDKNRDETSAEVTEGNRTTAETIYKFGRPRLMRLFGALALLPGKHLVILDFTMLSSLRLADLWR